MCLYIIFMIKSDQFTNTFQLGFRDLIGCGDKAFKSIISLSPTFPANPGLARRMECVGCSVKSRPISRLSIRM